MLSGLASLRGPSDVAWEEHKNSLGVQANERGCANEGGKGKREGISLPKMPVVRVNALVRPDDSYQGRRRAACEE